MFTDFKKYSRERGVSEEGLEYYSSAINPTIMEERQLNVTQMDVFSRLLMERIIFLGTEINVDIANIIQAQLLYLDSVDSKKDITMYINSPGGYIHAGLSIYDTMQLVNSSVSTICTGQAASMAFVLLAAGEKGKRFALPHSRTMMHQPSSTAIGQVSDLIIEVEEAVKAKKTLISIISKHTGQTAKKVEKDSDRDFWMDAEETLAYGAIDKIKGKDE